MYKKKTYALHILESTYKPAHAFNFEPQDASN